MARRAQNEDGGWGDTERGRSNVAATLLVQRAFRLTGVPAKYEGLTDRADEYLESQGGIAALRKRHGRDKSLSAPILASAALAGLVPWRQVPALPFEYTCLPQSWYGTLQLPVVSCAIPVLATVGQLKFHHDPPRNPITRLLRMAARKRSLAVIERMQPESGGFLESTPLTAFVVMSLASMGLATASRRATRRRVSAGVGPQRRQLADRDEPGHVEHVAGDERAGGANVDPTPTIRSPTVRSKRLPWALPGLTRRMIRTRRSAITWRPSHVANPAALDENCVDWLLDCQHDECTSLQRRRSRADGRGPICRAACPSRTTRRARSIALAAPGGIAIRT